MKAFSFLRLALPIAGIAFLMACEKEVVSPTYTTDQSLAAAKSSTQSAKEQQRPLTGIFFTSTTFIPDIAGGWDPNSEDPGAPAWYPGSGEGNLSHMGLSNIFFNEHIIGTGINEMGYLTGVGTTPPVNDFFKEQLAFYGVSVPVDVGWIFLDKHGNSIWSRANEPIQYWGPDLVTVILKGKLDIIGGTGRFANAKGQYIVEGSSKLNLVTLKSVDTLQINGHIMYY